MPVPVEANRTCYSQVAGGGYAPEGLDTASDSSGVGRGIGQRFAKKMTRKAVAVCDEEGCIVFTAAAGAPAFRINFPRKADGDVN